MNFNKLFTPQNIIIVAILYYVLQYFNSMKEGMGSGRGTLIQLSAGSGYYPFWQFGANRTYRFPYYRYMMPYYNYQRKYTKYYDWIKYPKPQGYYKYH